jgi:photosystem II stability/assembly factor-like uncharacterized protein
MSTDLDVRLQAAFRAAAEVIGEPDATLGKRAGRNHGRLTAWFAPLAAAAAVLLALAGSIAVIHNVQSGRPAHHPASPGSALPTAATGTGSPPTAATGTGSPPAGLTGPSVGSAQLLASGVGYARTGTALLVTSDYGTSWARATPAGLSANQLTSAATTFRPDGTLIIVTTSANGQLVTLYRRAPDSGTWSRSTVPVSAPPPVLGAGYQSSVSFSDNNHGWLVVSRSITHITTGVLLRTDDGGVSWVQAASVLQQAGPVTAISPRDGFLTVTMNGWTFASHDAGATWARFSLAPPPDRRSDTVRLLGQPTRSGAGLVIAAQFSTAEAGTPDGIGLYTSSDNGVSWTLTRTVPTQADESDLFTVRPDGSYALLHVRQAALNGPATWTVSSTSDAGRTFQDGPSTTQIGYPTQLWSAGGGRLWALTVDDGCRAGKSDCSASNGLLASSDDGASWRQLRLPG